GVDWARGGRWVLGLLAGPPRPQQAPGGPDDAGHEREQDQGDRRHRAPVALDELPDAVAGRRRPGLHGLVREVAAPIPGEGAGGVVAAVAGLLHGLHYDPVPLPPHPPRPLPPAPPPAPPPGGAGPGPGPPPPPPRAAP